jgi:6-phosphogluconate dehydrogenase
MARRLLRGGHRVVAYNRTPDPVRELERLGAVAAGSLADLTQKLTPPRFVWVMVPAGEATEEVFGALSSLLSRGDTIVDGGNSLYKDTVRRAQELQAKGLRLVDVGTSGGIWGLTEGYCMMAGGDPEVIEALKPVFQTLAPSPERGWGRVGPSGSGHFVKMVHNGIEYGMMQAYAEGFDILRAKSEFGLDVHQIAELWRHGSVVRSWLLDLAETALREDPDLKALAGWVADSGEGRWTVAEAIDLDVPAPVITLALLMRLVSRDEDPYAPRLLAALRNQFGGHATRSAG